MRIVLHALALSLAGACLPCPAALAAPAGQTPGSLAERLSPLSAAMDRDPLEMARAVRHCDPGAIRAALDGPDVSPVLQLAAIRGAPWLRRPEEALVALVRIMGGRDSLLAPAAAVAIRRIVAALDAHVLAAAEVDLGDLEGLRAPLQALVEQPLLRPDFRAVAAEALAWLDGLR